MIGRVYKINCKIYSDFCYIGSTIRPLNVRWRYHKKDYKRWKEGKEHCMSTYEYYDKYNIENFSIELIKEYKVCDKNHLKAYEQLWINKSNCMNINNPFRIEYLSKKKYIKENKEVVSERRKKYYKENKEVISERRKKYYKENKEVVSEYKKKYMKIKTTCECGSVITKNNLTTHKKSKKHIQYIEKTI